MRSVPKSGTGAGGESGPCWHGLLKEKAKARVDDLQRMLSLLQSARREGRATDFAAIEDQVQRLLGEWKVELAEPTPATSGAQLRPATSQGSSDLSSYIRRMLQLSDGEVEDDATSKLADVLPQAPEPQAEEMLKVEPGDAAGANCAGHDSAAMLQQECGVQGEDLGLYRNLVPGSTDELESYYRFSQPLFDAYLAVEPNFGEDQSALPDIISRMFLPQPPFLQPKCALWDCPRPAQGADWFQDYCSDFHATLAFHEGPPGMTPVLRPGGIDLKDGPLFAALAAKTQGKNVGIPECEGAATTKSPWNAPELFDLSVQNGESLREWLFFDKPRRAFDSGTRKQRSLPDYHGRGWHESRKQVMKEFGGLKRSYYMDPQPLTHYEWHLYEYEMNNCNAWALYRLELKLINPAKSIKGKTKNDPFFDLQQKMGCKSDMNLPENKISSKGRAKVEHKQFDGLQSGFMPIVLKDYWDWDKILPIDGNPVYGPSNIQSYNTDSFSDTYGTS